LQFKCLRQKYCPRVYYRKFIDNYTKYSKHLEKLCGSSQKKLMWTNECELAFQSLKEKLMQAPILAFPDFTKEFILDTDASFDRIGAVLSQLDEYGNEKVIAYGSHAMSPHEVGYCITRKELLAIYYFTLHFKHYLYGKRFRIRTDHKAITFMINTKKPITPQFQTWINHLSSLDMKLEYRKGEFHNNADTLSRSKCETCVQCQTIHEEPKKGRLKTRILALMLEDNGASWQSNSEEIDNIILSTDKTTEFEIHDGVVKTKRGKIWIPKDKTREFIEHTHKTLCHAGPKKVHEYIIQKFDMENLKQNINDLITSCEPCQKRKTLTKPTKEKILKPKTAELFEVIFIDFCGPLKTTISGKRYILAIIDQFSRYVSLNAVARQDEKTTADIIKNKWILKFGAPKYIHCDKGKSFESNLVKSLANTHRMEIVYSSPYHHSTNGLIERQFRTIRDAIHVSLKDRFYNNWSDLLPEIEFMINSTIQNTIGFSPAEVVYGKKIYREWSSRNFSDLPVKDYIEFQNKNRNVIQNEIYDNERKTKYDNSSRINRQFQTGDWVLVRKDVITKNDDRYDGPGEIIKKNHDRSYTIKMSEGKTITRNIEWLREFKTRGNQI